MSAEQSNKQLSIIEILNFLSLAWENKGSRQMEIAIHSGEQGTIAQTTLGRHGNISRHPVETPPQEQ
jgi:hypothetical protein